MIRIVYPPVSERPYCGPSGLNLVVTCTVLQSLDPRQNHSNSTAGLVQPRGTHDSKQFVYRNDIFFFSSSIRSINSNTKIFQNNCLWHAQNQYSPFFVHNIMTSGLNQLKKIRAFNRFNARISWKGTAWSLNGRRGMSTSRPPNPQFPSFCSYRPFIQLINTNIISRTSRPLQSFSEFWSYYGTPRI